MRHSTRVLILGAAAAAQLGLAQAQSAVDILTAGCADDAQKLCAGVQNGGGRIIACLKQHKDSLSAKCKQAAAQVQAQAGGAAPSASPSPPAPTPKPTANTAADAPSAAPSPKPAPAGAAAPVKAAKTADAPGSYVLLKKVTVIGPGADDSTPTQPAFELLVPSTWKFAGTAVMGGALSGCFADWAAVNIGASSPDGSINFRTVPDYSWQYADDPSVLQDLNDPNRRALGANGKKCPVSRPLKAEDYFRQNVLPKLPNGTALVSVQPFPELNEIVRQRRGLPPGDGSTGRTRTEAIRARTTFQQDGKDMEAWVALAVVVDISPAGRGSFYDSHAMSFVSLTAPKGKLDANDKLFQLMISSIQPVPAWAAFSNKTITMLYQAEAQKEAAIDRIHAALVQQELSIMQSVTANMMAGSNTSAMMADQNIREVQTFRDPSTGKTMELSSLYDHAWLNGSNQYVMSNDANFNPNGNLNGSWNQLQAVRPSP